MSAPRIYNIAAIVKRVIAAAVLALVVALPVLAKEYAFVASRKSDRYHYPDCRYARSINPENIVYFETAGDARNAGYVPCKVCKPPEY